MYGCTLYYYSVEMLSTTRAKSNVFLVGEPLQQFNGRMLPTSREVLQVYFYRHKLEKLSQKDAVRTVIKEVGEIWSRARVPTAAERNIIPKLESLLETYRNVCRNKGRQGPVQVAKETDFENLTKQLFDIAHHEAMEMIKITDDRMFLNDQRAERKMCMGKVDKQLTEMEERKAERIQKEQERRKKEDQRQQKGENATAACVDQPSTSFASHSDDNQPTVEVSGESSDDDFVCTLSTSKSPEGRKRIKTSSESVVSPQLAAALDRTNVTSRKAAYILHAAASTYGQDLSSMPLSASSIHRSRSQHRRKAAAQAKATFVSTGPLVIHFDGKLLPAISGGPEREDRVAILVTGYEMEKILAIPKVAQGTGEQVARAATEALQEWNLRDKVAAMSFDTTAANTGRINGACTLLQQKLEKDLLWLACRHHILEVICGDVFKKIFGPSSGPNVELFRRFQEYWPKIDQASYRPCTDSRLFGDLLSLKCESVAFCLNFLTANTDHLPRDDYKELLELNLIFLGEIPPLGIHFRTPGAFHHARWMSKLLYVLKLNLFQDQFRLTKRESSACMEFGLFVVLIYTKAWMTSPQSCDAPINDLTLIQSLLDYRTASDAVSSSGIRAIGRHLWYLGQELTPLALFSDKVSDEVKRRMAVRLNECEGQSGTEERSITYNGKDISAKTLDQLVGPASHRFFQVLQIDKAFMRCDVNSWSQQISYQQGKKLVKSLTVINDSAERGIALATNFNSSLTKREDEKQYLFQVVEMHRKRLPKPTKSAALGAKTD